MSSLHQTQWHFWGLMRSFRQNGVSPAAMLAPKADIYHLYWRRYCQFRQINSTGQNKGDSEVIVGSHLVGKLYISTAELVVRVKFSNFNFQSGRRCSASLA